MNNLVAFDFDGVIADTLHAAYSTWLAAGATFSHAEYVQLFEGNINDAAQPANIDFHAAYEPKVDTLKIFPGIDKAITSLAGNYTLTIVSSTITRYIETVLAKHNLSEYFATILGNDVATSKITKFNMILKEYEIPPSQCVMITDTLGDLREAHSAKLLTLAVTWGFHDRETLVRGNPAALVESPAELITTVPAIFNLPQSTAAPTPS